MLYGPLPEESKDYHNVPNVCNHRATPTSAPCSSQLFREDREGGVPVPSRRFWHQPLQSWLARFLSRPDIVKSLRASVAPSPEETLFDIWDGCVFREFKGPDDKLFLTSDPLKPEFRLVFSLFIDWFNPYGMKQSGKHASCGAIYMVCHNLPVHLHYQVENVYIAGIIPGPREPSSYHLNHVLRPLVDDLLRAWSPGFQLTRSAIHPFGCLVLCALIPLVCDLLAARKSAGFAGLGQAEGKFCSFCLQTAEGFSNTDPSSWRRRTRQEHLAIAKSWRDAQTEAIRAQIYQKFGVRWSELLRLSYWDPTRFTVIDTMHNLFAGNLQHHCRNILGMSAETKPTAEASVQPHSPTEQQRELDIAINAVRIGSRTGLMRLRRGYIVSLARANNVSPKSKVDSNPLTRLTQNDQAVGKGAYADALIDWVSSNARYLAV